VIQNVHSVSTELFKSCHVLDVIKKTEPTLAYQRLIPAKKFLIDRSNVGLERFSVESDLLHAVDIHEALIDVFVTAHLT
jgi:hypothetical protein